MNVLHAAALLWVIAVAALVAMVIAHAPVKTIAQIIHDAESR